MNIKEFLERYRGKNLLEHEAKELLKGMGLSVPRGTFIEKSKPMPAMDLSYPLVAKVSSRAIASKSDVGGVRLGIKTQEELKGAVGELMAIENSGGALVEEMSPQESKITEVIVGGLIDRQFGPVVMFGMGGVFVELFKDVAFALAPLGRPIDRKDALWLIRQVKGHRLLMGYRGKASVDIEALLAVIGAASEIISTGLVEEIDLNPVALYPKGAAEGALVLDAKIKVI